MLSWRAYCLQHIFGCGSVAVINFCLITGQFTVSQQLRQAAVQGIRPFQEALFSAAIEDIKLGSIVTTLKSRTCPVKKDPE